MLESKVKLSTGEKPFMFDADQHIYEPPDMWTKRVPSKFKELAPTVVEMPYGGQGWRWEGGRDYQAIGLQVGAGRSYQDIKHYGHSFEDTRPGCYDPQKRLEDMDLDGVDRAIIFPSVGIRMREVEDRDLMLALVRAYNDGLLEWCTEGDIDRLIPLFVLPDAGIEHAMDEFEHCAEKGFTSFMFNGWPNGSGRPDPADDQVWARCQEGGFIPCLHTGGPVVGRRFPPSADISKPPVLRADTVGPGKSVARGYNLIWFVLTGVLERFPELKLALVETGSGWLPFYYEQIDAAFHKHRTAPPFDKLRKAPSEYLKQQMWSTIQVDTVAIRNRHAIGVDRIMWSSDYPHSGYGSEFPNSRMFIEYQFRGVPRDELKLMLGENGAHLFGLSPTLAHA